MGLQVLQVTTHLTGNHFVRAPGGSWQSLEGGALHGTRPRFEGVEWWERSWPQLFNLVSEEAYQSLACGPLLTELRVPAVMSEARRPSWWLDGNVESARYLGFISGRMQPTLEDAV